MITTIVLDYGGVLAYPISGNWFIPYNLLKVLGIKTTVLLFFKSRKLNNAFFKGNEYLMKNHKLFTEEEEYEQFAEFYRIVFRELKIKIPDSVVSKLANEIVYNDYKVKFYDDVMDGIKELKQNYKVIILSDTWPSIKRILKNNGILELLDGLVISCNHNQTKETTGLFEIAINECGLVPAECLFIDDSPKNLEISKLAGFNPVQMDRSNTEETSQFPLITGLDGIKKIINEFSQNPLADSD